MSAPQDKTEKPTPRRVQKAREEGNVPRSTDFNSAISLTVAFGILGFYGPQFFQNLYMLMEKSFTGLNAYKIHPNNLAGDTLYFINNILMLLAPLFLILLAIGILSNFMQFGWVFTTKPLIPNITKLNPINGVKRMFSLKSIVELVKSMAKMFIIGIICYFTISSHIGLLAGLSNTDIHTVIQVVLKIISLVVTQVVGFLFVLGILDLFYQKYEYTKQLKMSKQEVKEERKNLEGDPVIKGKIRGIQMQMARKRMIKSVATADVVVTNPTHIAVALKYEPKKSMAPQVIAKGAGYIAEKIKEVAKQSKVPIVENKPLARSLYKSVDIGHFIPEDLYVAVAEVLAFVYRKNKFYRGKM